MLLMGFYVGPIVKGSVSCFWQAAGRTADKVTRVPPTGKCLHNWGPRQQDPLGSWQAVKDG